MTRLFGVRQPLAPDVFVIFNPGFGGFFGGQTVKFDRRDHRDLIFRRVVHIAQESEHIRVRIFQASPEDLEQLILRIVTGDVVGMAFRHTGITLVSVFGQRNLGEIIFGMD